MAFLTSKTKMAPSTYPTIPFHTFRAAQLLSSLVVAGIMFYFIYHLTHDHWNTPWTFIFFSIASILTISSLSVTFIMHTCVGLHPRLNLLINSALWAIWAAGYGMLCWWASKTITHACTVQNWDNEVGIMVCRLYKTLFAFGTLGFISTTFALSLDVWVFKRAIRLGMYNAMEDVDQKRGRAGFTGLDSNIPRWTDADGYAAPEEQFTYDTGYHGT